MKKFLQILLIFLLALNTVPANAQGTSNVSLNVTSSKTSPKPIDNLVGSFDHKIKIIFSDIDGTILHIDKKNHTNAAPQGVKQSVKNLQKAQIPLILTTGRIYPEAKEIAQKIGNTNTYIIAQQGAEIRDPKGKIIYKDGIKKSDVLEILEYLDTLKKSNNLTSTIVVFSEGQTYSAVNCTIPYNWQKVKVVNFKKVKPDFSSSLICISETNPQKLRFIQENLKKRFPNYNVYLSTDCYCDIISRTASKGNAIKKLADMLSVNLKDAATMGDAENDISMLKKVRESGGLAISVGNAMDSVKENSSFVTSSVYEDGFSKAVKNILVNNSLFKN